MMKRCIYVFVFLMSSISFDILGSDIRSVLRRLDAAPGRKEAYLRLLVAELMLLRNKMVDNSLPNRCSPKEFDRNVRGRLCGNKGIKQNPTINQEIDDLVNVVDYRNKLLKKVRSIISAGIFAEACKRKESLQSCEVRWRGVSCPMPEQKETYQAGKAGDHHIPQLKLPDDICGQIGDCLKRSPQYAFIRQRFQPMDSVGIICAPFRLSDGTICTIADKATITK